MNISGLVVTLSEDARRSGPTLEAIQTAGPFTCGERFGPRLTLALETVDAPSSADWHEWLTGLEGVVKVDVAFVYFDSPEGREHV